MDVTIPKNLYKYMPLNGSYAGGTKNSFDVLQDLLINGRIWYSKPEYFNDPFEIEGIRTRLSKNEVDGVIARVKEVMRSQIPRGMSTSDADVEIERMAAIEVSRVQDKHEQDKDTLIHRCGYISLCGSNDNPLMWSHYADHHRGICLRIRGTRDPFFEENGAGRVIKVTYRDEIETHEVELGNADAFFVQCSRKGKCWEYEDEYRVFRLPSAHDVDDAQGNHSFNSTLIDAVYFGIRTRNEDVDQVKKIVEQAEHEIELYKAIRHPDVLAIQYEKLD